MKKAVVLVTALATAILYAIPIAGAGSHDRNVPEAISDNKLDTPITTTFDPALLEVDGRVDVSIRLSEPSVAEGGSASRVEGQQAEFLSTLRSLDPAADLIASVQTVLNAVFVSADASALPEVALDSRVLSIKRVADYEMDLSETVPYIGASDVQGTGVDGSGVRVAVLDSGIDYYHANLGGSGDPADYEADDPSVIEPGTFPTAKVVGGFDFVGDEWPEGPLLPDDDPLDSGPQAGHGTHVAHIIGGTPSDEFPHGGVAPGVDLYAVKVCSSVSPSCSGIALMQAMEFAVDPDGDADPTDHVDIVNMSLGALYGQAFDDDLSAAVDNATTVGVLTVASAGNSADKPYVTGTPSASPTALSVAQTQVPSALLVRMEVIEPAADAGFFEAVHQPWSAPLTTLIEGPVQYGDGAGGALDGCSTGDDPDAPSGFSPYPEGSLAGKIVAVDRGGCFFSTKIQNIEAGGGVLGIIMLVAPGAPFPGGFGAGDPPGIPGYMISQAAGNILRDGDAVVRFDPAAGIPLIGTMVGSSSRGPTMQFNNMAKPEIGAPGASVSAEAGTGTATTPFGGTSGAAPMVSGSAALLMDAYPDRSPLEVKAVLMNTGDPDIDTDPLTPLTPITRIGGGEVRVNAAHGTKAAAWETDGSSATLSFGFVDAAEPTHVLTKEVTVRNYGSDPISYSIDPTFRYSEDESQGGVTLSVSPESVDVPPGGSATFEVTLTVHSADLKAWNGNSGSQGANGSWLTDLEYDGYLLLDADGEENDIHLPWHVLPRKSGDVSVDRNRNRLTLTNNGEGTTGVEAYTLLATSDDLPRGDRGEQNPVPDIRAVGYSTTQVPAGFCGPSASYVISFAVNSWERQTHANAPAAFEFDVDTDGDGEPDYAVFNLDLAGGSLSDGRNVTWAVNLKTGQVTIFFFTDHETNSANTVLFVCAEQLGLKGGQTLQAQVGFGLAVDIYFQGVVTDLVPITLGPGVASSPVTFQGNNSGFVTLDPGASVTGTLSGTGITDGALLLFRGGAPEGDEAAIIEP